MPQAMANAVPAHALLEGTPITVAGKIVQPMVRLQRWQALGDAGGAAFVRLSPHSVRIQAGDSTYAVPIVDPTQASLRKFFYLGTAISGVCLLLMLLAVGLTRRW